MDVLCTALAIGWGMISLTTTDPVIVHPDWLRLLRALHTAGLVLEIEARHLRPRLDYHASGPPKPSALMTMLSRYYAGDGDEERGRRRREKELATPREDLEPLRRVA